jgi:hypothetical protein
VPSGPNFRQTCVEMTKNKNKNFDLKEVLNRFTKMNMSYEIKKIKIYHKFLLL